MVKATWWHKNLYKSLEVGSSVRDRGDAELGTQLSKVAAPLVGRRSHIFKEC